MSKNFMPDVAKMLGVELGEEFNLVDKDSKPSAYNPFHIEVGGFMDCTGDDDAGFLTALLTGDFEIVKKPWKPKEGEEYYYIVLSGGVAHTTFDDGNILDVLRVRLGNCFTTYKEAKANVGKWLEYINQEPDLSWRVK